MLAYLNGEPAAQEVRQALRKAQKNELLVLFSLINYGECMYVIERNRGLQKAQKAAEIIDQLPMLVAEADRSQVFEAAHFKARHPISYADSFAVALAKQNLGRVMTGDPEFKSVEPEVAVHWLPVRHR